MGVKPVLALLALIACLAPRLEAADRPNILWITAEDMSPTLGCYGDTYAITPNIDALARRSVLYRNAFATAPVCSPSRSCLINGVYATTQGTHNMRSAFPLPPAMAGFPSFLRKAGYYTSNNVKTDYNSANWETIIQASWDEGSSTAHWRNARKRGAGKPFFSVFNLMTSHQSRTMVWPYEKFKAEVQSKLSPSEIHDPAQAPVPPYYPDTPVVRKTLARYYDCVTAMDKEVGDILKQLEDDGLADDTIVFFYSDHGSGLPRHKRALLDSGMRVAMIVRFPENWEHLAPGKPGTTTDRLVSFVDYGPTALSLAGVDIPRFMQGRPFLGKAAAAPREYVFGHRDRVDEVADTARSVRDARYLLIRNYRNDLGYNQPTAWPDLGEIRHEFYRLTDRSKMTDAQWHFAGPTRPRVELYDCKADPANLDNLADDRNHRETRDRLVDALDQHIVDTRDLGFIPEGELWRKIGKAPAMSWIHYQEPNGRVSEIQGPHLAAGEVGQESNERATQHIKSGNASVRYWGALALGARDQLSSSERSTLKSALTDTSPSVRIEAATALAKHDLLAPSLPTLAKALESDNMADVLHAARNIELLGKKVSALTDAMLATKKRLQGMRPRDIPATVVLPGDLDMAMFIGFSIDAFLKTVGDSSPAADAAWIDLFNGRTLDGWTAMTQGDIQAKAIDGEIQLTSKGKNLWFATERSFKDFELEAEARMPDGPYNSGLAFRCQRGGKKFTGYQCEIDRAKSGMIYAIGRGWVWPKGKEQGAAFKKMAGDCFRDGEWNRFRVRCRGDHLQIWVNGVQTADIRDETFTQGVIAIQHHGKGDVHRFRNIRIRELRNTK